MPQLDHVDVQTSVHPLTEALQRLYVLRSGECFVIIDCHGDVSAPAELYSYKANILSHRGSHGRGKVVVSDDEIRRAANKIGMAPCGHIYMLHSHKTDRQAE